MADDNLFTNYATSLLAATITDVDTVIQLGVGDGPLFPAPSGDQFFYATLHDDSGSTEVVRCTDRSGDLLTVVRGQDNTTAQAFTLGVTRVELRIVAATVEGLLQKNGGVMSGDIDLDGNSLIDGVLTGPLAQMVGGELVGTPMRGAAGVSSNELLVPVAPGRATIGGVEIVIDTDIATESAVGVAEVATQAEVDAGVDDSRIVTPLKLANAAALPQATEAQRGALEIADQTETDAGVDDTRAITPLKLNDRESSETLTGILALATQAEVDAGVDDTKAVTPLKLATSPIASPSLTTFTGTSTITGLTIGRTYAVTVYGVNRVGATSGSDTLGGIRIGTGVVVGGGTELADTPNQVINWPDGQAGHTHTHIITATTTDINGTVDHVSGAQFLPAIAMTAIQLD